jgi:uncharacterized protein (DUF2141 family)
MKTGTKTHLTIALVLALGIQSLPCAAQQKLRQSDGIHVEITGLRNDNGQVLCALFLSAADFPKNAGKALAHANSKIADRQASCEFRDVAPGRYAISVFHDENSNGKMDTNFFGMPREGVGASNNPTPHFGPPKFDAAAFSFPGGRLELKITVHYL